MRENVAGMWRRRSALTTLGTVVVLGGGLAVPALAVGPAPVPAAGRPAPAVAGALTRLAADRPGLPLGSAVLPESRSSETLAPGVTLTTIVRGAPDPANRWTVTVAVAASTTEASPLVAKLRAAGYQPALTAVPLSAVGEHLAGRLGVVVRVGSTATKDQAQTLADQLTSAGFSGTSVQDTAEDGGPTSGPWVVHVLRVDQRQAAGAVREGLATEVVPGRETTDAVANRLHALAAVNGGYFVIGAEDGTPGDLAGVAVRGGRLVSEAVDGRAALVLDPRRSRILRLSTPLQLRAGDGASRRLDGLNRAPGLIRSCGRPGDRPTDRPLHDVTCTNPNEIVAFDTNFGVSPDPGVGVQVALDRYGQVTSLTDHRGGVIPTTGRLLQGIGTGATWLLAHARVGSLLAVSEALRSVGRGPLQPGPHTDVVNGGPLLVAGGRPFIDADAEGFVQRDRPSFTYGFAVRRNPRTMAGIAANGDLLLVTVDGRAPSYSVGLSFPEESRVLTALGAVSALNLDGGGSTTLVARGRLLTRPSDATGERPVGDAIVVLRETPPS